MTYDLLVKKIDTLSETQKKSVFDYVNFLIFQNSKNSSDFDNSKDINEKSKQRLEYLDSVESKEITSRNIEEINQYISEIRNDERVF